MTFRAVQIDVEGLVSDPHRTATQLDRFPIFIRHQLVVLKAVRWLFRCRRLECILGSRRLARRNGATKSLVKHADRAELHCSREFIAAARARVLGLRFHRPNRPSAAF